MHRSEHSHINDIINQNKSDYILSNIHLSTTAGLLSQKQDYEDNNNEEDVFPSMDSGSVGDSNYPNHDYGEMFALFKRLYSLFDNDKRRNHDFYLYMTKLISTYECEDNIDLEKVSKRDLSHDSIISSNNAIKNPARSNKRFKSWHEK